VHLRSHNPLTSCHPCREALINCWRKYIISSAHTHTHTHTRTHTHKNAHAHAHTSICTQTMLAYMPRLIAQWALRIPMSPLLQDFLRFDFTMFVLQSPPTSSLHPHTDNVVGPYSPRLLRCFCSFQGCFTYVAKTRTHSPPPHIRTHTHAHPPTHSHIYMHTHKHTYARAHTRTRTRTRTYTHTHR
jgi:hypothetical protein